MIISSICYLVGFLQEFFQNTKYFIYNITSSFKTYIKTLQGHHGEAWGLAVSYNGQYVVSCGQDRVLRLYERSEEPLVLEDEQEAERTAEEEKTLATGADILTGTNIKLTSRKTVTAEQAVSINSLVNSSISHSK